jgi:hypothetical protein
VSWVNVFHFTLPFVLKLAINQYHWQWSELFFFYSTLSSSCPLNTHASFEPVRWGWTAGLSSPCSANYVASPKYLGFGKTFSSQSFNLFDCLNSLSPCSDTQLHSTRLVTKSLACYEDYITFCFRLAAAPFEFVLVAKFTLGNNLTELSLGVCRTWYCWDAVYNRLVLSRIAARILGPSSDPRNTCVLPLIYTIWGSKWSHSGRQVIYQTRYDVFSLYV